MRLIVALLLASHASAEPRSKHLTGHVAAIAINAAGTYLDMRSSLAATRRPGIFETSPLLRSADGRFHARGVVGIWAITGAVSITELTLWRRRSTWQPAPEAISGMLAVEHFRAARHNEALTKTP